jgi:hypothetical protein
MTQAARPLNQDPQLLKALQWRCIGPPRGRRVVAVAGDPLHPAVCYFGACAGAECQLSCQDAQEASLSNLLSHTPS